MFKVNYRNYRKQRNKVNYRNEVNYRNTEKKCE